MYHSTAYQQVAVILPKLKCGASRHSHSNLLVILISIFRKSKRFRVGPLISIFYQNLILKNDFLKKTSFRTLLRYDWGNEFHPKIVPAKSNSSTIVSKTIMPQMKDNRYLSCQRIYLCSRSSCMDKRYVQIVISANLPQLAGISYSTSNRLYAICLMRLGGRGIL